MKGRFFLLFLLVVASFAADSDARSAALPQAEQRSYEPHPPIRIFGNGDLEGPSMIDRLLGEEGESNGVRSGSGTAADPYVIERWAIEFEDVGGAIRIVGTNRHLVMRDIEISTPAPENASWPAIVIGAAENVSISNLRFRGEIVHAMFIGEARHLILQDIDLVEDQMIQIDLSWDVRLERMTFRGPGAQLLFLSSEGQLANGVFEQTTADGTRTVSHGVQMTMHGLIAGCATDSDTPSTLRLSAVEMRSYEASEGAALRIDCQSRVVAEDVLLAANDHGVLISSGSLTGERMEILDNRRGIRIDAVWDDGPPDCVCAVRESQFSGNDIAIENRGTMLFQAQNNWWNGGGPPHPSQIRGPVDHEPWHGVATKASPPLSAGWITLALLVLSYGLAARRQRTGA